MNDWQRGGDASQKLRRGLALKECARTLPEEYRQCKLCCFRQLALDSAAVWKFGNDLHLTEALSAWTVATEVAKNFKGGVPPKGLQGVILMCVPKPENVILNLSRLYRDPEFLQAIEREKAHIQGFFDGIGRYHGSQSEVVLETDRVSVDAVYALGGHSSSRLDIARLYYCHEPRESELTEFDALLKRSNQSLGPRWIVGEAKDRVLVKTLAAIERLRP